MKKITGLILILFLTIMLLAGCDLLLGGLNGDGNGNGGSTSLTVTFHPNGGTGSIDAMQFSSGETKNLPHNYGEISRTGYRFISWNTAPDRLGTEYIQQDSVTLTNSSMTLYAQWYKDYEIGENGPGGGLVFYRHFDYYNIFYYPDWLYLEAAPASSEVERKWGEATVGYRLDGPSLDSPGDGLHNTNLITTKFNGDYAAHYCQGLEVGGQTDWYLPTRVELAYMHEKLFREGWGNFKTDNFYWSSRQGYYTMGTPTAEDRAYVMKFDTELNGYTQVNTHSKANEYYVRAVRRF